MRVELSEGQQNALIIGHTKIVAPVVSEFRGLKGIPFEELVSEGMATLVAAAKTFDPERGVQFDTYATRAIQYSVSGFIEKWQELDTLDEISLDDEDRIHEWAIWGTLPSEGWTSLAATPEDILGIYEEFGSNLVALDAALIPLEMRERKMIEAHFLRKPAVKLDQLAREHKLSYWQTVEIIYGAVRKMREVVQRMKQNQSGVIRTGRPSVASRVRDCSSEQTIPFLRPSEAAH